MLVDYEPQVVMDYLGSRYSLRNEEVKRNLIRTSVLNLVNSSSMALEILKGGILGVYKILSIQYSYLVPFCYEEYLNSILVPQDCQ
jgi:hypothetical protein